MKKLSLLLVMLCFAYAADAPKGAFGINFGTKLSELKVLKEVSLTNGKPLYIVQPTSPMNLLSTYFVLITPKTNEVYEIWGDQSYGMGGSAKCKVDNDKILTLLENKYGKFETPQFNFDDIKIKQIGNIKINLGCRGFESDFSLRYTDTTLLNKAELEEKEITLEKTDASML